MKQDNGQLDNERCKLTDIAYNWIVTEFFHYMWCIFSEANKTTQNHILLNKVVLMLSQNEEQLNLLKTSAFCNISNSRFCKFEFLSFISVWRPQRFGQRLGLADIPTSNELRQRQDEM